MHSAGKRAHASPAPPLAVMSDAVAPRTMSSRAAGPAGESGKSEQSGAGQAHPASAGVVVIGGGVIGCSIAWYLTELGWSDIVLLERRSLGCGTTWHSQGLVGLVRPDPAMTRLALRTNEALPELEARTGLSTGFRRPGTLVCASSEARRRALDGLAKRQAALGIGIHAIDVDEVHERWPLLETSDLAGAFFMPDEGQTNPLDTVLAYAKAAKIGGATVLENTAVTGVVIRDGRVAGVEYGVGESARVIACERVVLAGGIWSREFAARSGIALPVLPVEQSYFVTEPVPGIVPGLPILRDYHEDILVREDGGRLTVGATHERERPWAVDGVPAGFCFDELPSDPETLEPMLEKIVQRIPILADVGLRATLTGPECVSADARYLLGEHPSIAGYFVATGMSGVGVGSSGGIGHAMAQWIVTGRRPDGLASLDVARFTAADAELGTLLERVSAAAGSVFDIDAAALPTTA